MVAASRPHVCISVARSTLAVWRRMRGETGAQMSEDTSPFDPACRSGGRLQPFLRRRVPRVVGARPADHGGPRPGVRPPPLERDGGVPLCGGLQGARGGAPPAPLARSLLAEYTCLQCGHKAAPNDPLWEEGVL